MFFEKRKGFHIRFQGLIIGFQVFHLPSLPKRLERVTSQDKLASLMGWNRLQAPEELPYPLYRTEAIGGDE